ncbi:hybrid sensor histidine kinase/response regulator [bacterium DOLZORAL124_64_63]|nr:MAG: hybrid sensor histidine kinase/response regulator [bacterium DOLZORAL124_64_63]
MSHPEKLKILLVDDRPENLLSLKTLLEGPDLEFLLAESGNEALNLMLDHDLALVLLDVQMPGMDGFEVAELMRRNMRTRHVPIIFVTAINKERRHQFHGYEAGAVDYLFKPLDPFIIRSKVNVFLEIKRQQLGRKKLLVELNQANNRLQEISARKSEFLAAASHELRTPLTVIKEYTSLVLEGVVGPLNKEQQRCLEAAYRNCNRLAGLVDDLLDLDSIESGQSRLLRTRVEPLGLIQEVLADFRDKMAQSGLKLEWQPAADIPAVLADADLVTQVLYNLLGNAQKFVPAGGTVRVELAPDGRGGVLVTVADDGPGISPQDRERVFEKFTRLERKKTRAGGTGLGLSLSRKLVEMQGGRLELESELGQGCVFRFDLPGYTPENHLEAFVADGCRAGGGADTPWTLLHLRGWAEDPEAEILLEENVVRLFRAGEDRVASFEADGERRQLVLLRTARDGAAAFLTRLREQLEDGPEALRGLEYGFQTLDSAGRLEGVVSFQPLLEELKVLGRRS